MQKMTIKVNGQESQAEITDTDLLLSSLHTPSRSIWLPDIDTLETSNEKIILHVFTGSDKPLEIVELSYLGNLYDDFLHNLSEKRNLVMRKYLSMNGGEPVDTFSGEIEYIYKIVNLDKTSIQKVIKGKSQILFFDDSFVIENESGDFVSISFNWITSVVFQENPYANIIKLDDGSEIIVRMLGSRFSDFKTILERLIQELIKKVASSLQTSFSFDESIALKLADKLRLGNSLSLPELDTIGVAIKETLFKKVFASEERQKTFDYLASQTKPEYLSVGLAPKFMSGDVEETRSTEQTEENAAENTGTEILAEKNIPEDFITWFFAYLPQQKKLAFEVTSEEGNATYLFKLENDEEYISIFVREINRMMVALNFKKEPIYLPQEKLDTDPSYAKYKLALRKLPYLPIIRKAFTGRAIHTSFEKWKADLDK
jgi:hypothetical protein